MTVELPDPRDADARELALLQRGPEAALLRRIVNDATATPIFMTYKLAPEWAEGVAYATDALEEQLPADPVAVLLLSEHAIWRLERAQLDDSDGHLSEAVPRLERLHAAACVRANVTSRALAARLHELARITEFEAFHDAPETHAEALGDAGIDALLRPPRGPSDAG